MEEAIEQLLNWTTTIGVTLNGIYPKALHGRGIGIVATRQLEVRKPVVVVFPKDGRPSAESDFGLRLASCLYLCAHQVLTQT